MHNSKKAQISDTMSWIVATIIIVLILSIPILLIHFKIIGSNVVLFSRVEKDPITTKSISGYLLQNYDASIKPDIIKMEADGRTNFLQETENILSPFLVTLSRKDIEEEWHCIPEPLKLNLLLQDYVDLYRFDTRFYFRISNKKEAILEFWVREKGGIGKRPAGVPYNFI